MTNSTNKFAASARAKTEGSLIMMGRDKLKTDDAIRRYPDGLTLTSFEIINGKKGPYPVFTIAEDPTVFLAGGKVLNDIVNGWLEMYQGDLGGCQKDFAQSGGIRVKLTSATSKNGDDYTAVEVL